MAKQKIIAGHLDHKHGYYYMVLSLPNPEKGNRKLPKWFPTGIPYDGKRQTERDAKRMLKEWREDFTSGKLTLAMIDAKKRSVPFPVSWTVKMKKKQKETQDILSYHTQAAGCSDKARAKASGGRQPIEECGRTGL